MIFWKAAEAEVLSPFLRAPMLRGAWSEGEHLPY